MFTMNRKALLGNEDRLRMMLNRLAEAAGSLPVIAPLRGMAAEVVSSVLHTSGSFRQIPPLSYLEFGWLTAHARGIVTDSGNVAEEATFNAVPCITLNSYTEHQETVTVGSNVLVGQDIDLLGKAVTQMVAGQWKTSALPERWDGRTAERIVSILLRGER